MTAPAVSVVIPTYNRAALLAETLDSVLAQTFTDFEVIVVDDGSTDGTAARLAELRATHGERLRVIGQANAGVGVARNRGIDAVRGRLVALLDSDDLWRPDTLRTMVRWMADRPAWVAAIVPWARSSSPSVVGFPRGRICEPDGTIRRPIRSLAEGSHFAQTSATVFDRDRCRGVRYATEKGAIEDMQFYLGLFARGPVGVAGEEIMAIYRDEGGSLSSEAGYFDKGLTALRRAAAAGEFDGLSAEQRRQLRRYFAHTAQTAAIKLILAGRRGRAAAVYLRNAGPLLRLGRYKFLLAFPPMLLAPQSLVERRWRRRPPPEAASAV